MPGPVPPALARERELRAWELACAGRTQTFIAQELGISQPAVSKILARVSARALKQLQKDVEQRKALSAARLDHIYGEAMAAWEESKKPHKKSRSKKTRVGGLTAAELLANAEDGKPLVNGAIATVREETTNEAQTCEGNFLFLQTAITADAEYRKLWGLNAPKQVDLLDKRRPLEKLTDEELAKRVAENAQLLAADGDQV